MWNYNKDLNNWSKVEDKLQISDFEVFKQELSSYRLYSKCLSGASYIPINGTNDIYDILSYNDETWYISITGSQYSNTLIPAVNPSSINNDTSYNYYSRNNFEYSLTLKNLFTPNRLIRDSLKNYLEVDVATTEELFDLFQNVPNRIIDGVRLIEGHRVLVKDQKTRIVLPNTVDPDTFFSGRYEVIEEIGLNIEYSFYNEQNGIYTYVNNNLIKSDELDDYDTCVRYSVIPKLGELNKERQYHLVRLNNGFYPTTFPTSLVSEPIEFEESKNWILRHQVDYNNLFEINYYDVIKHGTQSYTMGDINYQIPERIISIGEFGVILNNQYGVSNIIDNKYKVNLRSIDQTSTHYWICGDSGILLKVRKHDFNIERIELDCSCPGKLVKSNLKSISFYDDLNGVVVGDFNNILVTIDGGFNWKRIRNNSFDGFNYNKVLFNTISRFFVAGEAGVFIEFNRNFGEWNSIKRRVSKFIDLDDDYLLVDNINDMLITNIDWNINFTFSTQSIPLNKDILLLVTDDNKFIIHDINGVIPDINPNSNNPDFVYLDFPQDYGDIINIERKGTSSTFYFTGNDGLYSFDIDDFQNLGVGNSYSNVIQSTQSAIFESSLYSNQTFDYLSQDLILAGNNSLLVSSTYSTPFNFDILDPDFESRLKSKLLFLDYDIASKLNWFTDDGDYRLPSEISFTYSNVQSNDYINFEPLIISATFPSFMTQSETNWIEYWRDRKMTFEYYSNNPMDGSILISTSFSHSTFSTSETISNISRTSSNIINLAPTILDPEHSRYNEDSTLSISAPTQSFDLYLYDYLGVYRVDISYPVDIGDVIRIESQVVSGNFIVNKIIDDIDSFKYIYFFTEFNDNIIRELSETTVTITNLNKYSNQEELSERFNLHDFSNGYDMVYSTQSNLLEIKPKFNNLTSYYNLATGLEVEIDGVQDFYTSEYTSGFLKFGYKPTYNLLDYLESINDVNDPNPVFLSTKTYYAMPDYRGIPIGNLTTDNIFIELPNPIDQVNLFPTNIYDEFDIRLNFGEELKLEWESIFINTFVDININGTASSDSTERLLVYNKYEKDDDNGKRYVIEFIKKFDFSGIGAPVSQNLANLQSSGGGTIDIISRRELWQISDDLQYLNNISRPKNNVQYQAGVSLQQWNADYDRYERDINFKINTDSYAKILLSDSQTKDSITGIIYTDFKNELAFNVVNLSEDFEIPILNTANFGSNLFILCSEKHGLKTGDGVNLEFNGGTGSSEELNQQYFGYHPVTVVNEFQFYIDGLAFGSPTFIGNDTGIVRYVKKDPLFNYQPVDLLELGSDKRNKIAIELDEENTELVNGEYNLIDIDFTKYRFRLVDGLNIETLSINYPWIYEAEISNAVLGENNEGLVWYSGTWECGRWFGGTWQSGTWVSGDWYDGTWNAKLIKDNWISVEVDDKSSVIEQSTWFGGRWYNGTWNNGTWNNGRWYGGNWNNGTWFRGIWNDGTWNSGNWNGGVWVLGTWNNGFFNTNIEPSYWLDGNWNGGDFENGIWYNGFFDEKNNIESRFGVRAFNSRTATWHSGKFVNGSFHSRLNLDDLGNYDVSEIHKFSIWRTGQWLSGDYYGGVAYNMDFKSGTWHGGILEDIQVVGIDDDENSITLNGIFKFNIGDEIVVIDNDSNSPYNSIGSNSNPGRYRVLSYLEDEINELTTVYIDTNIILNTTNIVNTGLRVVSLFRNCNWKSGIWTNGIYVSGDWEGGIWYNGIFENNGNFL